MNTSYTAIYFVGAGGIGMSALERYFAAEGYQVGGYDRTPSALTDALIGEGIQIHYEDNIEAVAPCFKDPKQTLVVYTPAIPASHGELTYFREHGFEIMKRAQVLGLITRSKRGLCVAGTHGKTTTSSMIAHLLKQSETTDCNAFLGGILKPYGTNLMLSEGSDLTVIEADEFDRSFHTLSPYMAVITSCDPDHLDIYGTEEAYRESFAHFTSLIRPEGLLLLRKGIKVQPRLQAGVRLLTYGVDEVADFSAENVRIGGGTILFDLRVAPGVCPGLEQGAVLRDMEPGVPAPINVENATAALAICLLNGCREEELRRGLKSFGGALRRFDFYVKSDKLVLMDDYAHHPDEIRASLRSVRQLFPGRRLTVVFQPHLFTRTRDLADGFAEALSLPDRTILLPIYPAREQPIEGVTSEMLLARMTTPLREVCPKEQLISRLKALQAAGEVDVLVMMGAGDIDRMVIPVRDALLQ
jgi:UDP-N-acetylmuramate--alanine ligase